MNKDKYVKVAYERLAKNGSCLGYCNLHNCHLTLKDLNKKNCVDKQCNHLIKKEHMYWTNKLLTKENRLLGKSLNFSNTDINTYRNVWKSLVNLTC